MNIVSRQIVIGAFIAAALMLGANANAGSAPPQSAPATGAQLTLFNLGVNANLAGLLQSGRDKLLGIALDSFGEIAAHLKQI